VKISPLVDVHHHSFIYLTVQHSRLLQCYTYNIHPQITCARRVTSATRALPDQLRARGRYRLAFVRDVQLGHLYNAWRQLERPRCNAVENLVVPYMNKFYGILTQQGGKVLEKCWDDKTNLPTVMERDL
jgi:hypothetical protein